MNLFVKNRTKCDRGASMVEYSLLVALIGIVSLVAAGGVGQATEDQFDVVAAGLGADSNGEDSDQVVEEESDEDGTPEADEDADDPQVGDDDEADPDAEDDEDPLGPQDEEQEDDPDDDEDEQGTPEDEEDTEPADEPIVPGSVVADAGSSGSYYWWNDSKHGGEGAWKASVMYQNDWTRHQYLTLEVTRVDQRGNRSTSTVNSFYVPAQGTSNYESWDNSLRLHKGDFSGVLSVEVKVVGIQTSDESWATVSYATDGPTTVITPPQTP